jgi:2-polyprenyl-3-methyl-5-hydroxy-6-metoxy-1,4-benzoquinol methylase
MRLVDAKAMGIAELYEGVISNTIIHHIPDPSTALAAIAKRVAPGGTLMVRDLYRPDDLATLNALVSRHAGEESPAARALFKASLHAALTLQEIRDIVASLDLPPDGVRMTSDRHWTWVWHRG